jgi:hypothetical protein
MPTVTRRQTRPCYSGRRCVPAADTAEDGHGPESSAPERARLAGRFRALPLAAAAKAAAKAKELLEEQAAKAAATSNRWKQWAKHSDEQQSTSKYQLQTV